MDFDEYEYLEKTIENPEAQKSKKTSIGGNETVKSEEREKNRSRGSKHRSNGKDGKDDNRRRSKRSKAEDDSRCRDWHKERGSSHHQSPSRDGERDRHKSSHNCRERGKDKDMEERKSRDRDRDRDHDHYQDRNVRGHDSERETKQSRGSGSWSERHQSDLDEKEREMSRDKELGERVREGQFRERDRESGRKKKEAQEPMVDPERDQRAVFAYQIALKADKRDVYEFFSRAGKVRAVRLIMDRNSRRSKGVGYIEFYDAMSVPMAIALSGQPLFGQPVMVKPSEAEKNLIQSTTSSAGAFGGVTSPFGARRLDVGNLNTNITEDQLRQVFEPFGTLELVQLPLDENGHCKGFGFVQFARLEDARNALNLNGQVEIAGRMIKVSTVTDQPGIQDVATNTTDLDDNEGAGLSLNAHSRALLMQKLDRTGTASSIAGSLVAPVISAADITLPTTPIPAVSPFVTPIVPGVVHAVAGLPGVALQLPSVSATSVDTIGNPSECLLLKNMFDPTAEMEPDFDLDIKEDVEEECSKFGHLKHAYVDKNTAGFVYVRFDNTQSAMNAQRSLHGRWFAGKMITATFMTAQTYEAKFPESK